MSIPHHFGRINIVCSDSIWRNDDLQSMLLRCICFDSDFSVSEKSGTGRAYNRGKCCDRIAIQVSEDDTIRSTNIDMIIVTQSREKMNKRVYNTV
jgi:hypothetical protein